MFQPTSLTVCRTHTLIRKYFNTNTVTSHSTRRKAALITGSATAIALAKQGGYAFALHYNSASQQARKALRSAIKSARPASETTEEANIAFFQADMADYSRVRTMFQELGSSFGGEGVDVLFNNAGAPTRDTARCRTLADVPIDAFDRTWRINTGSGILLTQLCLSHMEE